jgi:hypothetical protein
VSLCPTQQENDSASRLCCRRRSERCKGWYRLACGAPQLDTVNTYPATTHQLDAASDCPPQDCQCCSPRLAVLCSCKLTADLPQPLRHCNVICTAGRSQHLSILYKATSYLQGRTPTHYWSKDGHAGVLCRHGMNDMLSWRDESPAPAALDDTNPAGPEGGRAPELRERPPPTASCPTLWTAAAGSRAGLPPQAAAAVAAMAGEPAVMELAAVMRCVA